MLSKTQTVIPEECIGFSLPPVKSQMNWIDAILYHISIGFGQDPTNEKDTPYIYEGHQNFKVFPTNWCVVRGFEILGLIMACPGIPFFNALKILHGETAITVHKEIYVDRPYYNVGTITDVADKGSGCLVTMDIKTYEEARDEDGNPKKGVLGDLCVVNTCSMFIRDLGGFGFKGKLNHPKLVIPPVLRVPKLLTGKDDIAPVEGLNVNTANFSPNTVSIDKKVTHQHELIFEKPFRTVKEKTSPQTAHFYRLCGDGNPLHIDPKIAKVSGFDRPILHGLCHFGISAKMVVQTFLNGDHSKLKYVRVRFTSHFYPGETLVYKFWTRPGGKVLFSASTEERGNTVIKGEALLQTIARL